jgi:hypothetical protein
VLEIGRLGDDGTFSPLCAAAESGAFSHLALEADRDGSLWLAYTSPDGTWVAQLDVGSAR